MTKLPGPVGPPFSDARSKGPGPAIETKGRADWSFFLFLVGVGLAVYVLSTGPVAKLYQATGEPRSLEKVIEIVYAPVEVLYHNSSAFERLMDWYMDLWGSK